MEVNGLPLPVGLEQIIRNAQGRQSAWSAREQVDSYGNYFAGYDPEIYSLITMAEVTATLPDRCPPMSEEFFEFFAGEPEVIPYVTDFAKIVVFAELESGETFCLDYRENEHDPEVILYEGAHWRRVAPSFSAFMELLEPSGSGPGRKPKAVDGLSLPGVVNGLPLPAALVQMVRDARGEWTRVMMKEPVHEKRVNAYGDEFDCGDLEIYDYNRMVEETDELPDRFEPWTDEEYEEEAAGKPDVVPIIRDYPKIVVFGQVGSGEPYCLDYRENLEEPQVIYLPYYGTCWRRVAPTFDAFLDLIVPYDPDEDERREKEEGEADRAMRDKWEAETTAIWTALGPEELRAIAYHEAGHAVAAMELGLPLLLVDIQRPMDGSGQTHLAQLPRLTPSEQQDFARKQMVFRMAGTPARQLVDPDTHPLGHAEDEHQAYVLALQVIGEPEQDAAASTDGNSAAATAYVEEARARAQTLVHEHRGAIAAVADKLLSMPHLGGDWVRLILDEESHQTGTSS